MGAVTKYFSGVSLDFARLMTTAVFLVCPVLIFGQKKILENRQYPEWLTDYQPKLSRTGKYAVFQAQQKWFLYSLGSSVKLIRELPAGQPEFSEDGKVLMLKDTRDTLHIYALNEKLIEKKINGVGDWAFSTRWITYIQHATGSMHLYDFSGAKELEFKNVTSFKMSPDKTSLVFLSGNEAHSVRTLLLNNPNHVTETTFSEPVTDYVPSVNGACVAISTKSTQGETALTLLLAGSKTCIKAAPLLEKLGAYRLSESSPWFSPDGKYLFLQADTMVKDEPDTLNKPITDVEVWHYQDRVLQSMQALQIEENEKMTAVFDFSRSEMRIINHAEEDAASTRNVVSNGYFLIFSKAVVYESAWDERNRVSCWLFSSSSGKRTLVFQKVAIPWETQISPDGRFVIWYDNEKHAYYSFDINSHITRKISLADGKFLDTDEEDPSSAFTRPYGLCGWSKDGKTFFVYDRFDIWQLDPSGAAKPNPLTKQWGRSHQIRLRMPDIPEWTRPKIDFRKGVILQAFDIQSKQSGFVKLSFQPGATLNTLYMGPHTISDFRYFPGINSYVLCRSTEKEAPNIFWSQDLKSFRKLSDFSPQKQVNWLSTELLTLTRKDSSKGKALLYKPENFDPGKKYPVIVHFYEKRSDQLHRFLTPGLSVGEINIPFYVSNGYLVLVPDIDYKLDSAGRCAFKCVQAGIDYLKSQDFVDIKAIGIQGHSFGGYEVNYILTQTRDISAACEAAGVSDPVAASFSLNLAGVPQYGKYESGQHRKSGPVWDIPDAYILETPLLYANRITAPLLIMHNKKDPNVNFEQGLQFYLALRRLRKPVWLLQYPNSGHIAYGPDEKDFSIRMLQFFDHFLKHRPAPVWLTKGIPAKRARIDSGLELGP